MQCSKCGSDMVLRERKSDGNKFWGCSSFPKCNGITRYVKGSEKQTTSGGFKPIVEKKVDLPTPDSRFQQPILTAFLNEHKNLMVKACAGSGKTTLLKMLSYQLPKHKSIVYVVYNAKIRDEAVKVLPDWVSPMTSHQLGFAAIRNYNGKAKTELDDQKVQNIFKKMIQDSWDEEKWMIAPVCNLVSKLKNTLAPSDNNTLMKVAERFNIDLNDSAFRIFDYVREVLRQNNQTTAVIDFDDMLYLVWKLKMPVQKFDIILTDEVQDFNQAQLQLLKAASHGETQIIGVGDSDQSMYGFRGADLEAMSRMEKFIEATTMPLSITYRVPKSGVRLVNELFPEIAFEAALWAEEGVVRTAGSQSFLQELVESDMVLCRTNAPLVKPVLTLLRQGIKACIAGRDIGNNLANLLVRFNKKGLSLTEVLTKICDYRDNECGKLIQLGKEMAASNLVDTVDTVIALSDGMRTVDDTIARIKSIFTDNNEGITFSTVHRAKGLEAPRVFILEPQLLPHPMAKADWEQVQEKNIAYVAITRHKKELIFVGQGLGSFYQGSSEAVQFKEEEVKEEEEVEVKTESFGEEKQVSDTFVEVFGSNKVKSVPVCPF